MCYRDKTHLITVIAEDFLGSSFLKFHFYWRWVFNMCEFFVHSFLHEENVKCHFLTSYCFLNYQNLNKSDIVEGIATAKELRKNFDNMTNSYQDQAFILWMGTRENTRSFRLIPLKLPGNRLNHVFRHFSCN